MTTVGGGLPIVEVRPPRQAPLLVVISRRVEIGRECDGVIVDDPHLSRRHLALEVRGGQVVVVDLGSRNGTELDGNEIDGPLPFAPGQLVVAGGTQIRLTHLVAAAPSDPRPRADRRASTTDVRVTPKAGATDGAGPTTIRAVADLVLHDPVVADRAMAGPRPGGTVTFLFSDIEASTSRTEAIGDRAWVAHLTAHNRVVEGAIGTHGGTVVKSIGDGYMATFPSAHDAARAAIAIQKTLAARPIGPVTDPVRVRIGLHTGEAITVDGDLFGLHVTMAARVADQACGGQVLTSALTRAVIEVSGDVRFADTRTAVLKGLSGEHVLSELDWETTSALPPTPPTPAPPSARASPVAAPPPPRPPRSPQGRDRPTSEGPGGV